MSTNPNTWQDENLMETLKNGGVAVMPTDTIYGLVGRAENKETVEGIYKIKNRNPEKSFIILIGNINELSKFDFYPTEKQKEILNIALNKDTKLIFISGPAGSSKTYISIYCVFPLNLSQI